MLLCFAFLSSNNVPCFFIFHFSFYFFFFSVLLKLGVFLFCFVCLSSSSELSLVLLIFRVYIIINICKFFPILIVLESVIEISNSVSQCLEIGNGNYYRRMKTILNLDSAYCKFPPKFESRHSCFHLMQVIVDRTYIQHSLVLAFLSTSPKTNNSQLIQGVPDFKFQILNLNIK